MRRRCMGILIFILSLSLVCFVVFTCSKKSTKQESTPSSCSVSPVSLDFDTVTVGEYSEKSFVIRTTGTDTLSGTIIESCSDFSITSGGGAYNLAQGESLIVIVRFQPDSVGDRVCVIETGQSACSDVNCIGTGGEPPQPIPEMYVYPTDLDFGTMGSAAETTFIIANIGEGILSGVVAKVEESACSVCSLLGGTAFYDLTAGESETFAIRFMPLWGRSARCVFGTVAIIPEISDTVYESVICIGYGQPPAPSCSLSSTLLDFGTVHVDSMARMTFTITNVGPENSILYGEVKCYEGYCGWFVILQGGGNYSLPSGESREVMVGFNPTSDSYYNCTIYPDWHSVPHQARHCENVVCIGKGTGSWD